MLQSKSSIAGLSSGILLDKVENYLRSADSMEYVEVFSWAFGLLGFSNFAYMYLPSHPFETKFPVILGNYPHEWLERYQKNEFHRMDSVISQSAITSAPFYWNSSENSTNQAKKVFHLSASYGIEQGFSIPVHEPGCAFGSIHLASELDDIDFQPLVERQGHIVSSLAFFAHQYRPSFARQKSLVTLSERERECLYWVSNGKTYNEIGIILSITERTVKFHVKQCMEKLDAVNTKHAMVKALRLGIL